MKDKIFVLFLIISSLFLGGCEYSHEITDMAYAVALGLDQGEEGIRFSIQFARPLSIAGGSGGGESSSGSSSGSEEGEETKAKNKNITMLTIDATDIYTAISVAESSLSKRINLSHTKLLLFSAELAKEGIGDYVALFMKNNQFSPNTYTAVSLCPAEDYMRTVNPSLEVNPAKYYTLLFSKSNGDLMPSTSLRDLYFNLSALGREPVLPAANINKDENTEHLSAPSLRGDYEAGELPKGSENRTDVSGMAVFQNGKLREVLSSHDAMSYHMLTGQLRESYLTMPSKTQTGKHITIRLTQPKRPKKHVTSLGDQPQITASVPLSAELVECPKSDMQEMGLDGLNQMASEQLSARLESFLKLSSELCGADVVGFGETAKMKFADYPAWQEYNWPEKYQNALFSATAKVNISREGLVHEQRPKNALP